MRRKLGEYKPTASLGLANANAPCTDCVHIVIIIMYNKKTLVFPYYYLYKNTHYDCIHKTTRQHINSLLPFNAERKSPP